MKTRIEINHALGEGYPPWELVLIGLAPVRHDRVLFEHEFSPNPSDLRHHGRFFSVADRAGKTHLFGEAELRRNELQRQRFLAGEAVDLPYTVPETEETASTVDKDVVLNAARSDYKLVVPEHAHQLERGQMCDLGGRLRIRFRPNSYAHCFLGIDHQRGEAVVVDIDNRVHEGIGLSYNATAKFVHDQGCNHAIVLDNGFDRSAMFRAEDGHWTYKPGGKERSRFAAAIMFSVADDHDIRESVVRERMPACPGVMALITRIRLSGSGVHLSVSPEMNEQGFQRGLGPAYYETRDGHRVTNDFHMRHDCWALPTHVEQIQRRIPNRLVIAAYSLGNLITNREYLAWQRIANSSEGELVGRRDEMEEALKGRSYSGLAFEEGGAQFLSGISFVA